MGSSTFDVFALMSLAFVYHSVESADSQLSITRTLISQRIPVLKTTVFLFLVTFHLLLSTITDISK